MKIVNRKNKIVHSRFAFTIVELLISLAISALLLTAIAVAFNGSVTNYQKNEDLYRTVNNARQALFRMTTQLRTAKAATIGPQSAQCTTAENENITYQFANGKLYLITNGNQYVLCENITGSFTTVLNPKGEVKGVQISVTVQYGSTQKTLSAATIFRKNL